MLVAYAGRDDKGGVCKRRGLLVPARGRLLGGAGIRTLYAAAAKIVKILVCKRAPEGPFFYAGRRKDAI